MSQEEISAIGHIDTLTSSDFASSYQAPSGVPQHSTVTSAATAATVTSQPAAVVQAAAAAPVANQPSVHEIQAAVDKANANLASANRVLAFRVDVGTGITIAMIRNSQTGAVLQQIPGTNVIAFAQMLADWSPGKHMLLDLLA